LYVGLTDLLLFYCNIILMYYNVNLHIYFLKAFIFENIVSGSFH